MKGTLKSLASFAHDTKNRIYSCIISGSISHPSTSFSSLEFKIESILKMPLNSLYSFLKDVCSHEEQAKPQQNSQ